MNIQDVTPLILTYNEESNIGRTLERLKWATNIVVLDSGSTDRTAEIVQCFSNVSFHIRPFDDHTSQWNHGVDLCVNTWVLALDADYMVAEELCSELENLTLSDDVEAFYSRFNYCVFGQPLRATLYPPRAIFFMRDRCRYQQDGHTQLLHIPGRVGFLRCVIDHDDRKPLSRWIVSQDNYARLEALKLLAVPNSCLRLQDRLRMLIIPAPLISLVYCLLVKGLILDGYAGWYYSYQRVLAEILLSLRLLEYRIPSSAQFKTRLPLDTPSGQS